MNAFVEDLPDKLRIQVSFFIYEDIYQNIKYFRSQSFEFIAWLCPRLLPGIFKTDENIFDMGDKVEFIYFVQSGKASYVIP